MFENDPGDKGIRSMVHGWQLTKVISLPHIYFQSSLLQYWSEWANSLWYRLFSCHHVHTVVKLGLINSGDWTS